jgi:hypothetical protein
MHYVIDSYWVIDHNVVIHYASGYGSLIGLFFFIEQKNAWETGEMAFF